MTPPQTDGPSSDGAPRSIVPAPSPSQSIDSRLQTPDSRPRRPWFTPIQLAVIAGLVAIDVAAGSVVKPLLHATGIRAFFHADMILPMALILLARLLIDRTGTVLVYQLVWGAAACVLIPNAVLPGPLKLLPLAAQGLAYDLVLTALRRAPLPVRLIVGVIIGGMIFTLVTMGARMAFGFPTGKATGVLLLWQWLAGASAHIVGALVAWAVWRRLRGLPLVQVIAHRP